MTGIVMLANGFGGFFLGLMSNAIVNPANEKASIMAMVNGV